jgi:transposase
MSVREIAKAFKQSESLVRRYLKEWNDATPKDRRLVRSWLFPQKGK